MWNVITNVIPVITGAIGTISKSFRKYFSNARNQETTENNHTEHCTHTAKSTNVKEQKI
jgi:Sec-independent protein translocase protein TatA